MLVYGRFAEVYDKLMADVDRAKWAEYILSLLPGPGLSIADVACGTGALSIPLTLFGHRVTGVDSSMDMLRVASEKARLKRLDIPFICEDMRMLSLHKRCDAIVSACDGVNYLLSAREAEKFFRAAHASLKPGGALLFDVSSRYKLEKVLGSNTFAEDGEGAAYIWRNEYDEETKLIHMELTFFEEKANGLFERFTEEHTQRAHSEKELINALMRAGFEDIAVYAAFTRERPGKDCERIQFSARKREDI